jgi:hypothetical protein
VINPVVVVGDDLMHKHHVVLVSRTMASLLVAASTVSYGGLPQPQASGNEQTVWNLEHAYWRYAQDNDLTNYRALWHKDFFGWPASYAAPTHKDHITDWITSLTGKGLAFKSVEFKTAGIQVTGNAAVTCYWISYSGWTKTARGWSAPPASHIRGSRAGGLADHRWNVGAGSHDSAEVGKRPTFRLSDATK